MPESGLPTYLALVEAIARAIRSGELKAGDRLPPQRRLAWRLGINPSTTLQAYREAARRHLVSGEVGRGTYVLAGSQEATLFLLKQAPADLPGHAPLDLSTNVPVLDPANRDLDASLENLRAHGGLAALQGYASAAQVARGRLAGSQWLRGRGLELAHSRVRLCAGAQQGVFAALLALCEAGEPVLVEAFTSPGIKAASRQLRLPLHGIPLDARGILPEALDRLARATAARVVVLTPCLQNPTGASMDAARRAEIAAVARRHGLWVIEDDVYGGLGEQPPLAEALPERCLLVTSLSKSVAPSLRLGFLAGPLELLERIDREAQATNWAVSPLCLAIGCEWVEEGVALRRLAWQREELARRWRLARTALGTRMPAGRTPAPHLWLTGAGLFEACRAAGVESVPAEVFAVAHTPVDGVRISLAAAPSQADLKRALDGIARHWPPADLPGATLVTDEQAR
nr:PLP-dependent aminotransferase family protein [Pseudomonas sp. RIT-PI-AD]